MWKTYFKPPYKCDADYCVYWWHKNGMLMNNVFSKTSEDNGKVFKHAFDVVFNGEQPDGCKYSVSETDKSVITRDGEPFLRMRGWGYLTGCGALNMSPEKAIIIQDSFLEYCLTKLNSDVKDGDLCETQG